uniref:Putative YqaH-like protein n=1 Tax=Caudovirales sp. ctCVG11 TaxID=2825759 RepID=A0A8S5UAU1_9CAUD|nr:MAG TPA: putative YqaH-like protein [Caudovirales sp. ctCVG11]
MLIKNYYYEKEKKRLIPIIKREKEQNLAQHIKKMQEKGIDVSINFTPKSK